MSLFAALFISVSLVFPHHGHVKHHAHKPPTHCVRVASGWCLGGPPIITPGR